MKRKAWMFVLLVGMIAALMPSAGAATAAKPTVLTRTLTLTGSQTGYVPVTVVKDMQLGDPFVTKYRDAVSVTGGGDAAGFALIEDGLNGQILLGGRSEAFAPYVKDHGIAVNSLNPNPQDGATYTVPAGSYRLYLITGGKPTTVTLRFLGGTGSSRLTPTKTVESVVQQVDLTSPAPGPAGGVYSGGGAVTLTTPVLQFSMSRLDTAAHTETLKRYCYYFGKPTGPQPYGPTCAAPAETAPIVIGGGSAFVISAEGVGPQSFYGWNASLTTSRSGEPINADIASGISYASAGVVTGGDYTQFWLSLDAPAARPAASRPQQAPAVGPAPVPSAPSAAAEMTQQAATLPATGPPTALAVAPALLLAAAAARRRGSRANEA
jgi:hypothetical protein